MNYVTGLPTQKINLKMLFFSNFPLQEGALAFMLAELCPWTLASVLSSAWNALLQENSAWALKGSCKVFSTRSPSATPREMTTCSVTSLALLAVPLPAAGIAVRWGKVWWVPETPGRTAWPHLTFFQRPPSFAHQMSTHLKPEAGRMQEPHYIPENGD